MSFYDHAEHDQRWKAALERELERLRQRIMTYDHRSQEWDDAHYTAATLQKAIIEHAKALEAA